MPIEDTSDLMAHDSYPAIEAGGYICDLTDIKNVLRKNNFVQEEQMEKKLRFEYTSVDLCRDDGRPVMFARELRPFYKGKNAHFPAFMDQHLGRRYTTEEWNAFVPNINTLIAGSCLPTAYSPSGRYMVTVNKDWNQKKERFYNNIQSVLPIERLPGYAAQPAQMPVPPASAPVPPVTATPAPSAPRAPIAPPPMSIAQSRLSRSLGVPLPEDWIKYLTATYAARSVNDLTDAQCDAIYTQNFGPIPNAVRPPSVSGVIANDLDDPFDRE